MVNWNRFDGRYIEFVEGVAKRLVLTNWRDAEQKFDSDSTPKPAVEFDVVEEDAVPCTPVKTWRVSNYTAIEKLKPFVEEAEKDSRNVLVLNITRVGQGRATQYAVVKAPLL